MRGLRVRLLQPVANAAATIGAVACLEREPLDLETRRPSPTISVGCDASQLRSAIEGTSTGVIQLADGCTYVLGPQGGPSGSALIIRDKNNLIIQGAGMGRTHVRLTRDVWLGFHVVENVDGLTIRDLTIEGSITERDPQNFCGGDFPYGPPDPTCDADCPNPASGTTPNTYAINTGGSNLRNIKYSGLEIRHVAVGITSFGACGGSTCSDVTIENNYIHDIRGTCPGAGYGVETSCTQNLVIRGNTISRAERHSIYQGATQPSAQTAPGDDVLIDGNLILDHRHPPLHDGSQWKKVALTIARSSFVTAVSNVIVNSHEMPISVERNENTQAPAENVFLINNRIIGDTFNPTGRDIWIDAGGNTQVVVWFNRRNEGLPALDTVTSGQPVPPQNWIGTQWMETQAGDGKVYVMHGNTLHRVSPTYQTHPDSWTEIHWSTTNWAGFQSMATMGDGYVYVMQSNVLHRVAPQPSTDWWPYWYSLSDWSGFQGMTAQHGNLYVMQSNCFHKVAPQSSISYWPLTYACGWTPFASVRAAADGFMWVYRGGLRVDKVNDAMTVVESIY